MKRSMPSPTQSRRNFLGRMSAAVGAMSGLGRTIGPMFAIAGVTASARAAAASGVEREWTVDGVIRGVFPELGVLVITHGDINAFMPAMTMGFRVASPKIQEGLSAGDAVRFTVRGVPPNVAVIAIQKITR